jgi:hypothetical protein
MSDFELDRPRPLAPLEELLAPVLPPAPKTTETSLTFRLPVSLKQTLKADAEARGLNLSDYLRLKLASETLPPRYRSRTQISSLDRSILIALNQMGVNLNQIARKLNSQKNSRVNGADRQTLALLLDLLQRIEETLMTEPGEPEP